MKRWLKRPSPTARSRAERHVSATSARAREAGGAPLVRHASRAAGALMACVLLAPLRPAPAAAQEIAVQVGQNPTASVAPGEQITVDVLVDMSNAGGLDLADLEVQIAWDASLLSFVSTTSGNFGSVSVTTDAASGTSAVSLTSGGTTSSFTLLSLTLEAGATKGLTTVSAAVNAASDGGGADVSGSVTIRNLELCIGTAVAGLFGDVTGDGTVNIVDAQQIARFAVGLSVGDPDLADALGDVTGDGTVNIIDAQQTARFAVGLSTASRAGEEGIGTCDGATEGGFTLSLSPSSVDLDPGTSTVVTVQINRTGDFTGSVSLSVSGDPSGLAASFDPNPTGGDQSELTLEADAGLAAGTLELTVTGSASGLADETATLTVNVQDTGGGIEISLEACEVIWFAMKDGDDPWTAVPVSDGSYTFTVTSDRGGIAYVEEDTGLREVTLLFGDPADVELLVDLCEDVTTAGKTITGTVLGLGTTDFASVALGPASASTTGAAGGTFTLEDVPDGSLDLGASRRGTDATTGEPTPVNKILLRRDQDLPDGTDITVDFGSSEAFDPVDASVTVEGLNGTDGFFSASFTTDAFAGGLSLGLFSEELTGNTVVTGPSVPTGEQASGDLHFLLGGTADDAVDDRGVFQFHQNPDGQTLTVGPALTDVTVTVPAGAPVRPRMQHTVQPEYDDRFEFDYSQVLIAEGVTIVYDVAVQRAYLGSQDLDLRVPDLTGLAGWESRWNFESGTTISWSLSATGVEVGDFLSIGDGFIARFADTDGEVVP